MDPEKRDNVERKLVEFLGSLKQEYALSDEEINKLLKQLLKPKPPKEEINIPVSIFKNQNLGSLEAIVKYLRENLKLKFSLIASLTNRDERALAVTYRNARLKMPSSLPIETSEYSIPVSILADRKISVLEHVAYYLKTTYNLNYHQVAVILNRDDRTIWTVYQRAVKKRG